ncbi:MAG: hypothetical protein OXC68_04810 [Aestuariivita sp.]|nr:hypothetical protein [Aestuariivita sp.]
MTRLLKLIAFSLCVLLAACGSSDPDTPDLQTTLETTRTQTITRIVSALTTAQAPTSDPTATTAVTFDGTTTTLTVTHPDESTITFGGAAVDSANKQVLYTPVENPPAFWTGGHSLTAAEVTDTHIRFASIETAWDTDDPSSSIAFGFWEQHGPEGTDPSFGAFVEGPEIAPDRTFSWETFTTTGTATYEGVASGFYAYEIPDNADSAETGLFQTGLTLNLDLTTRMLSGNTGGDGVQVMSDGQDRTLPITVELSPVTLDADGAFTSDAFTIQSSLVTDSRGSWSGRLSNKAMDGQPRLAAGTLNGSWTDIQSGKGALTGAWIANGTEPDSP